MYLKKFTKTATAIKPYTIQWADWLEENGNTTLVDSTWSITPNGTAGDLAVDVHTRDDLDATVVLSGGIVRTKYCVVNHIVDSAGNEDDRSFDVVIIPPC